MRRPSAGPKSATLALAATVAAMTGCARLPFLAPPPPPPVVPSAPDTLRWTAPVPATAVLDADATDRLLALARTWTAVRWFHPAVAADPVRWEVAYLAHVEAVVRAADAANHRRAVRALLDALGDPDTRLADGPADDGSAPPVRFCMASDGDALSPAPAPDGVLDLRGDPAGCGSGGEPALSRRRPASAATRRGATGLTAVAGSTPQWRLVRRGLPSSPARTAVGDAGGDGALQWDVDTRTPPPDADSTTPVVDGAMPSATNQTPSRTPATTVVVVDSATPVPAEVLAAHAAGAVRLVGAGAPPATSRLGALQLPFDAAHHVRVRVGAVGAPHAPRALVVDTVVADGDSAAFALAARIAAGDAPAVGTNGDRRDAPRRVLAIDAGDPRLPSLPERLLVVTQLWGMARYGFAYAPLADRPLDDVAREAFTDAAAADSPRRWAETLARFAAALDASNVVVATSVHPEYGQSVGRAPFDVALLGDRAIVVGVDDGVDAPAVGDELLALGGEPIDKRLGRWRPLLGASNDWARARLAESWLHTGPAGSTITARFRAADGSERDLQVTYVASAEPPSRRPPRWRGVAWALDTVAPGVVRVGGDAPALRFVGRTPSADVTWQAVRTTARALVVDLRGARGETARMLAPALTDAPRVIARESVAEWALAPGRGEAAPWDTVRRVVTRSHAATPRDTAAFTGPVAILIDAGTMHEAEVTAAWLRRGGPVRALVGGSTAGAVGEVAVARAWGGVSVAMPVSTLTDADGRIWQRVGLAPDLFVEPTLDGVRAGRDELLDAAVRWIDAQLAPPPPVRRRR